jgi:O-antigen/teichoic acid export membrane protein
VTNFSPSLVRSLAGRAVKAVDLRRSITGFLVQVGGKALALLSVVIMTHALSQADYGIFAYARSWVMVLGPIATLGLGYAAYRFLPEYKTSGRFSDANGYLWASVVLSTVASVVIAGAVPLLKLMGIHPFPAIYEEATSIVLWITPMIALMQVLRFLAQTVGQIGYSFVPYYVFVPLVQCAAMGVAIWLGGLTLGEAVVIFFFAHVVSLVAAWAAAVRAWRLHIGFRRPTFHLKPWLGVALPLTISSIAMVINQQADLIVVGSFLRAEDAALYSIGMSLSLLVSMMCLSVSAVFVPKISANVTSGNWPAALKILHKSALLFFFPALGMVLFFLIFGHPFLRLFGPDYEAAYAVVCLLSLSEMTVAASEPSGHLLNVSGHHKANTMLVVVGAIANVALNLVLTPRYGIVGASTATLVTTIGWTTARLVLTYRYLGIVSGIYGWLAPERRIVR